MLFWGPKHFTCVRREWCEEAATALLATYFDVEAGKNVEHNVKQGAYALWRVNDNSWCVTEVRGKVLFIWCYVGQNLGRFIHEFVNVARASGLEELAFYTHLKGALRIVRRFNFKAQPVSDCGETRYTIDVRAQA